MEHLEKENRDLKDEISRHTTLMEFVIAAQSQQSPPPTTPPPEGYAPTFPSVSASSSVLNMPPPIVHTLPRVEDPIYHSESSEGPDDYEKMDEMRDQFIELRKELKTLRGKDYIGKSDVELCLVPNVKIPVKFKDSLTGAALGWYVGLESANIRTFNDLGEAFVKKYKYNINMALDIYQLRSIYDNDTETFKEYAQRWSELAAQISLPLEEKEKTKIFLKTLSSFYYEQNGQKVPLLVAVSVVNIMDMAKVTHSGRVFSPVFLKVVDNASMSKKAEIPVVDPKAEALMSSLKDAQEAIQAGSIDKWDYVVKVVENKNRAGLGFQQGSFNANDKVKQPVFYNRGFIHEDDKQSAAIIEDSDEDKACDNFVTHG
ncbi:uncharacterized protein LOC127102593 [Lathyrus oleraceus]|uniref:uncharacterized protein LOC127102593 n=1 Tax=Pisum sativum TaxID=3888 RepID=UPI0021CF4AC2|nr:uncharacterized protein LOC127102593 [Pisum sativum]